MERKYGWVRQPQDERDLRYSAARPAAGLPAKTDLRSQLPEAWDQLSTSSCTAHGIAACLWSGQVVAGQQPDMPSRLFLYYNERAIEGDPGEDSGAFIRDGIKVCNRSGIAPEKLWPFEEATVTDKPPQAAYDKAVVDRIHFYAAIDLDNMNQIRLSLSHRYPVVFGFDVYSYFESEEMADTGVLKMPGDQEYRVGGHCVAIVGHDDEKSMVLVRNSWGPGWGQNGHFWMPYEYLTSELCSDGWMVRLK